MALKKVDLIQSIQTILQDLREGKTVADLEWIPPVVVDRKNAQGLTDLTMDNAFKMNVETLPAYSGVADSTKGFLLIQVTDVDTTLPEEEAELQTAKMELQSALAAEYIDAYLKSLRQKNKVTINQSLLQSGEAN